MRVHCTVSNVLLSSWRREKSYPPSPNRKMKGQISCHLGVYLGDALHC